MGEWNDSMLNYFSGTLMSKRARPTCERGIIMRVNIRDREIRKGGRRDRSHKERREEAGEGGNGKMPLVMRGGHKGGIAMFAFNFCPEYRPDGAGGVVKG